MTPTSVLFVCMGNICRSPAAEGIFRRMVEEAGLDGAVRIDSAGTIGFHAGSPADERMRRAAAQRGYALDSLSRPVQAQDLERFDYVIAMDRQNLSDLQALANSDEQRSKLRLMCDFARRHAEHEVPDPYYGGARGFEHVMDLLEDACEGLLQEIRKQSD